MLNLTDPGILQAEKFGSRDALDCITQCEECGGLINKLYDSYCTDKKGNCFCGESCAMEHYGINIVEV